MKHIVKQDNEASAQKEMYAVTSGDVVVVHVDDKEIPCTVRMCREILCQGCVLRYFICSYYSGSIVLNKKAFIPVEDTVE